MSQIKHDERSAQAVGIIGTTLKASPKCLGCGEILLLCNAWMVDGCKCNSPLGVNDANRTRWELLLLAHRDRGYVIEKLETSLEDARKELSRKHNVIQDLVIARNELELQLSRLKECQMKPLDHAPTPAICVSDIISEGWLLQRGFVAAGGGIAKWSLAKDSRISVMNVGYSWQLRFEYATVSRDATIAQVEHLIAATGLEPEKK